MRNSYQTTNGKGLDRASVPMKLWEKAKKYGTWNPIDIDFSKDAVQFKAFSDLEKEWVLQPISQFQAGEEAVTLDLLPLIMAIAKEGRLEEEMFLTSFLWEEAKHIDGFNLFLSAVLPDGLPNLEHLQTPSYKHMFHKILPEAMNALLTDTSPVAMVKASVTYNMIIEGVLAETGYYVLNSMLKDQGIMPGMTEFTEKLKQDESRHIAYGIYLISRLVSENGDEVWEAVEAQMNMLLPISIQIVNEGYDMFEEPPFGLEKEVFSAYAIDQFQKRFAKIESARSLHVSELIV